MRKLLFILFSLLSLTSFAQQSKFKDSSNFKIQLDYLNNYVYNGRVDSITSPYFITTATVQLGKGYYSSFSANYLLATGKQSFDFFELDLGKEYSIGKNTTGEIYFSKYFYNANANLLNGNISADIGGTLNQDLGPLQINNTADLFFSNGTDFQYQIGLSKSFDIVSENGTWDINPSITTIGSTLSYYESIVNKKLNSLKGSKANKNNPSLPTVNINTTVENKGFKLMASEFSLPITYETNKWGAAFTATYALPFNPVHTSSIEKTTSASGIITTKTIDSTPYSEKQLNNVFYFQTGIFLKF